MAKNVFNPEKQCEVTLAGHLFAGYNCSSRLPGHFAADTVEVTETYNNGDHPTEYAVFTVDEPEKGDSAGLPYPHSWVGTYRISMDELQRNQPWILRDAAPDPEPEPDPSADQE